MYCSPFSLIAYFTKFICVCYRINLTGGQWKKAVKRKSINQWSRVAAGIVVHFCTWNIVCWTCLGLTIKKLAVLLRSVSGGCRWWLQKPLCYWASMTLKPCCPCAVSGIHLWRGPHVFYFALEKIFCDKIFIWQKMPWVVWVTWIIGKCGLNLVNNDLFWKVKVFSLKLFETKGYSLFNLKMTC